MGQLVELKKNAAKFEAQGVEVVAVFREEKQGVEGLKMIKEKTGVDFTLGLDTPAEQTKAYSPGRGKFNNYVIDKTGKIRGILEGDLRNRAKSDELLKIVASLKTEDTSAAPASSDQDAVKRAVLDYVEGIYDVKPELIERSVHPELKKFGFGKSKTGEFQPGSAMTFAQLRELASKYNQEGRIAADAPKEVELFEVMDKIATAKLTAAWGTDYFHLVKEDGKWKILQVVWQSPTK